MLSAARVSFVARAIEAARDVVPRAVPALGPVTVAQAILESRYGESGLTREAGNYFGMKAGSSWRGSTITMDTTENVGAKRVAVRVPGVFRRYATMRESFRDHAALFTRLASRYHKALASPNDPVAFAHALTGVYATDPLYGAKLVAVMREHRLFEAFGYGQPAISAVVPRSGPSLAVLVAAGGLALWWISGRTTLLG